MDIEGIPDAGVEDPVGILLFQAGADGVEVFRHIEGFIDHDVLGEPPVGGQGEAVAGDGGAGAEIGDITLGVDAGVRAAAARYFDFFTAQGGEGFF